MKPSSLANVAVLSLVLAVSLAGCSFGQTLEPVTIDGKSSNEAVIIGSQVVGSAPGTWFFEAQLLLELQLEDASTVMTTPATADGEWMTEDQVPFSGTFDLSNVSAGTRGVLTVRKNNPSGLPEHDKEARFDVTIGGA